MGESQPLHLGLLSEKERILRRVKKVRNSGNRFLLATLSECFRVWNLSAALGSVSQQELNELGQLFQAVANRRRTLLDKEEEHP
jgi:hypothetical protein